MDKFIIFLFGFLLLSSCLMAQRTTRALVIGISDYEDDKIPDLDYAHRDAAAFVDFLKSKPGGEMKDEQITLLTNDNATYAQIYAGLDWLIEESKENDNVFIYFSGHGDVETKIVRQQGFLLAHNTPAQNYRIGALRVEDVNAYLETLAQLNKAKITIITDACRSGSLAGGTVGVQATATALTTQFANEIKIMSCQANEFSVEGKDWGGGRGLFSYHLVDGLIGMADGNNDLQVNLLELRRYLEDNVGQETNFSQLPVTSGSLGTRMSFVDEASLAELKRRKAEEEQVLSYVSGKGNMDFYLTKADTSVREMYDEFLAAVDEEYFLPTDATGAKSNSKSASELYDVLVEEATLKPVRGLMKRNFAAALQDKSQQSLNAYLRADPEEMAKRFSSAERGGEAYESNPAWIAKAAEVLGEGHPLYAMLKSKQYYYEGVLLRLEGDREDNDALFQKALEKELLAMQFDSNAAYIHNELGLIYGCMGEKEKEVKAYKRALELAPKWVMPYNNLSASYISFGDYEKALIYGLKTIEIDSSFALGYGKIGESYNGLGEKEKAMKMYEKVISLDPTDVMSLNDLGYLNYEKGNYEKAENYYKRAIGNIKGIYVLPYMNLALLYNTQKRFKEEEAMYLMAIENSNSNNSRPYNYAGWFYYTQKKYEKAELMYLKAIEIDPEGVQIIMNLGILYHDTNRYEKAEDQYHRVLELQPENKWGYYNILCIKALQKNNSAAMEWLRKALENGFDEPEMFKTDSNLENIRDLPEFRAMVKQYFPNLGF